MTDSVEAMIRAAEGVKSDGGLIAVYAEKSMFDFEVPMPEDAPDPGLWRVLVVPAQPKETTQGGLALPDSVVDAQRHLNCFGRILKMGPLAFKSDNFFKGCEGLAERALIKQSFPKVGDWIIYGKYAGQPFEHNGIKMRIINDDEYLAKASRPDLLKVYL